MSICVLFGTHRTLLFADPCCLFVKIWKIFGTKNESLKEWRKNAERCSIAYFSFLNVGVVNSSLTFKPGNDFKLLCLNSLHRSSNLSFVGRNNNQKNLFLNVFVVSQYHKSCFENIILPLSKGQIHTLLFSIIHY